MLDGSDVDEVSLNSVENPPALVMGKASIPILGSAGIPFAVSMTSFRKADGCVSSDS